MANIFITSDTHFGHWGVCKFLKADGTKLRPWDNPTDMDEALIENWNKVVRPNDKVYHLGDVLINRKAFPTLGRLNGDKVLIKGNHDIFKAKEYLEYFRDIRAYQVFDKHIMSHIPVHESQSIRFKKNIHGHLHSNILENPWYMNVCVEQTSFTPISWEGICQT